MYLVDADDAGQKDRVLIQAGVKSAYISLLYSLRCLKVTLGFRITLYRRSKLFYCSSQNYLCFNTISYSLWLFSKKVIV